MSSIFLSHNSRDKSFVRRLAADLREHGVKVWVDEAEILVGDSLIQKISKGIVEMEYLGVVLSPNSVGSPWVQKELEIAMNMEIGGRKVKVLPILYRRCPLPAFLEGKLWADFTNLSKYQHGLRGLLNRLNLNHSEGNVADADDEAIPDELIKMLGGVTSGGGGTEAIFNRLFMPFSDDIDANFRSRGFGAALDKPASPGYKHYCGGRSGGLGISLAIFLRSSISPHVVEELCDKIYRPMVRPALENLVRTYRENNSISHSGVYLDFEFIVYYAFDSLQITVCAYGRLPEWLELNEGLIPEAQFQALSWIEERGITGEVMLYSIREGNLSRFPRIFQG